MAVRVTVAMRCLLYLLDHQDITDDSPAVGKLVQDGIAEALGIRRAHASRALRALQTKGYARTSKVHPQGKARRRLAYFLTDDGFRRAKQLQRHIEESKVTVVDAEGREKKYQLYQVYSLLPRRPDLSSLLQSLKGNRLDLRQFLDQQGRVHGRKVYDVRDAISVPDFRGRAETLARLDTFLEDPKARAFLIVGLPGVGKTAVASRWVPKAKGRVHVLWRRLNPETTARDLTVELAGMLRSAGHPALSNYLQRPSEGGRDESMVLLKNDLSIGPYLLILDNAHQAGRDVTRFLPELFGTEQNGGGLKILLLSRERVSFWRAEDVARGKVWVTEMDDLRPDEAEAMLVAKGVEVNRRREILKRCGGHPLSLELAADAAIPLEAARRTSASVIAEEVLSRLDSSTRSSLAFAAVLGEPVPLTTLGAHGWELLRLRLLREVGDGKADVHDLVREAVLQSLPPDKLASLHIRAAKMLSRSRLPRENLAALRHFMSGDASREAATLAAEHGQELIDAGLAEGLLSALDQLSWESRDGTLGGTILLLQGHALFALGRWAEASRVYERCSGSGSTRVAAEALLGLGKAGVQRHSSHAIRNLTAARTRLERLGSLRLLAEVHYWIGVFNDEAGRLDEAREAFERGKAIAFHAGDRRWDGLCTYGIAGIRSEREDHAGAVEEQKEALQLLEREGSRIEVMKLHVGIGGDLLELGRFDEAKSNLMTAATEARSAGALDIQAMALFNLASLRNESGRAGDAAPLLKEALRLFEQQEKYYEAALCATWLGSYSWIEGREDMGNDCARQAIGFLSRTTEPALRVKALRHFAHAALKAGRKDDARRHLGQAIAEARDAHLSILEAGLVSELGRIS